jgi:hypothetical protein
MMCLSMDNKGIMIMKGEEIGLLRNAIAIDYGQPIPSNMGSRVMPETISSTLVLAITNDLPQVTSTTSFLLLPILHLFLLFLYYAKGP